MMGRGRKVLSACIKCLVTLALLAWVLRQIDLLDLWRALADAHWVYLLPIWALAIVSYWLLSFKLSLIMARQGCHLRTSSLFAISAVTTLYGMVLPGMLDLSAKWLMLRQQTGKGINVLSSMVYNQFTATLVVLIAGIGAVLSVTPPSSSAIRIAAMVSMAVLFCVGFLVLHRSYGPSFTKAVAIMLRPLPKALRDPGQMVLEQLADFQTAGWGFHANALVLTVIANVLVGTIIYMLAAKAAGISVPIGVYFWQCTAIFILGRLPISIAEFGIREATLVGSMASYGVEPSAALVMSMALFTNRLLFSLIGAAVQLYWAWIGQGVTKR